jgi:transposase
MTRLYGWGEKSERVDDYVPDVRFERTSIVAALNIKGVVAPLSYRGAMNSSFFKGYIDQCLAPCLKSGDVLIIDNLSSHKVKYVLKTLYNKGVTVLFLPPYSPDFNPIEMMWSKLKAVLRKLKARTYEEIQSALKQAFDSINESDITNWIKHDGYCVNV